MDLTVRSPVLAVWTRHIFPWPVMLVSFQGVIQVECILTSVVKSCSDAEVVDRLAIFLPQALANHTRLRIQLRVQIRSDPQPSKAFFAPVETSRGCAAPVLSPRSVAAGSGWLLLTTLREVPRSDLVPCGRCRYANVCLKRIGRQQPGLVGGQAERHQHQP